MAACLAAPWPSQQRSHRSTSERHSALARMRERHARADRGSTPDPEPPRSRAQQPRPPAQPRSGDARPGQRPSALSGSGRAEPWAPAWSPEPHEHMDLDGCETPPPKPQRPAPPNEASRKPWVTAPEEKPKKARATPRSDKLGCGPCDDGMGRGNRVRATAEVKTARDVEADDECLPPGVQSADFKTLQAMIARGIQDAETGAVKLESDVKFNGEDDEERRFRERQRQRREQEAAQREREREVAKQRRRREQEERERRQAEELEREEREELSYRQTRAQAEEQCRRELAAAVKIQARVRGHRSRAGKPYTSGCVLKPVLHWEPWMKEKSQPSFMQS